MTNEQKQVMTANIDAVLTKFYIDYSKEIKRCIDEVSYEQSISQSEKAEKIDALLEAHRLFKETYKKACRTKLSLVR